MTLTLTLPLGENIYTGRQVTFQSPCASEGLTGVIVDGVTYALVDAHGNTLVGKSFTAGTMVSVIFNLGTKKAYVQNADTNAYLESMLAKIISIEDLPNLHIWKKYSADPRGYTEQTLSTADVGIGAYGPVQLFYGDECKIVDGQFSTGDFQKLSSSNVEDFNVIKGKYVISYSSGTSSFVHYVPEDASISMGSNKVIITPAVKLTINDSKSLGYVASKADNTSPTNGEHADGNWYVYHKQLGE